MGSQPRRTLKSKISHVATTKLGTVIPADLPLIAQAPPGAAIRFRFVSREEALTAEAAARDHRDGLRRAVRPLLRDPAEMPDLLSYTLISGATTGKEEP